ncbi:winged helix-turn-helix domain-containing protein [Halorussus caseinilyticus]|uniref:Helix-turn-helix domain-containing protein n=1 Tax=Halorussus caseinilyticus TaxID=3034025 RepID=A0ABD5WJW3_9EURY|nr:winged helix-turn-helix domain-containing protein [Halorussus sp. DT72]
MSEDCDVEDIAALLEDETVRTILTETSIEPMSANALSERCGASEPTIYRRLKDLRAYDLIEEQTRPDPTGGHHYKVYSPRLRRVTVELEDGSLTVELKREEDIADRFTDLVEGM